MTTQSPEVLARLDALAAKLGVAAGHIWTVLVRQAYVEAAGAGLFFLIMVALTVAAVRIVRYGRVAKWYSHPRRGSTMSSQPTESIGEDLRNALQVLNAEEPYSARGYLWIEYAAEDVEAIRARLEAALAKLERQPSLAEAYAAYAQDAQLCRDKLAGRVTLRADGDHIVRAPLDYVVPGQVDPVLRGQEITEDGE